MNNSYEKLLQKLHIVQHELQERNDPTLNLCILYIQEAISYARKMDLDNAKLHAVLQSYYSVADLDVCDCWD